MALNFSESKKIPITEYLARLGFEPAKVRGNDYWYRSPFRSENDPSFKVNIRLNLWYDHGSGDGGTILDLGAKINSCSIGQFLAKLEGQHIESNSFSFQRKQAISDNNKLVITSVNHLNDQSLVNYLRARGISRDVASQHCMEANFLIGQKAYQAVAFQNQSGGFELRNSWFKGSSSPKDISYFNFHNSRVCVLEGFIDFLSLKQLGKDTFPAIEHSDFLILNSLSLLSKNLETLKSHEDVSLFLDNDAAGLKAKSQIQSAGIRYSDQSKICKPFKDVNEYLVKSQQNLGRRKAMKL
jgi:DNA primase